MPRGSQPGERRGGRQKGTPNKKTRKFMESVAASGLVPLEYMLKIMRDEMQPQEVRMERAKAAAPFVHPRLAAVKVAGDKDAPLFDLSALTDNELAFLQRTILKAQQIDEGGKCTNPERRAVVRFASHRTEA
jgi:hypothetical protein